MPKKLLFEQQIVPLDVFDKVVILAMPILISFESLTKIQRDHDCELFPYVGLTSENHKVLGELFSDFTEWMSHEEGRREKEANELATKRTSNEGNWMGIFDAGDEAIQNDLNK